MSFFFAGRGVFEMEIDIFYMIAAVISLAFSVSIGFLFGFHTYLLMYNYSTLEIGNLNRHNPFAKNDIWSNLEQTFGQGSRLFWLIPMQPYSRACDGINYII
jgi:hypothetical protein